MAKRAREQARKTKQDAKRERRQAASLEVKPDDSPDEDQLMEEFRILSEGHAAGNISQALYDEERSRIFGELGIETG